MFSRYLTIGAERFLLVGDVAALRHMREYDGYVGTHLYEQGVNGLLSDVVNLDPNIIVRIALAVEGKFHFEYYRFRYHYTVCYHIKKKFDRLCLNPDLCCTEVVSRLLKLEALLQD